MNVLVINSGSSSLKYQLFDMDQKKVLAKGLCERIGIDGAVKHTTHDGKEYKDELTLNTHDDAIKVVLDLLTGREYGVIDSVKNIDAIGQRVAHGGKFKESVLVDQEALDYLYTTQKLAPLHNPPVVKGIEACKKKLKPKLLNKPYSYTCKIVEWKKFGENLIFEKTFKSNPEKEDEYDVW